VRLQRYIQRWESGTANFVQSLENKTNFNCILNFDAENLSRIQIVFVFIDTTYDVSVDVTIVTCQ